MITLTANGKPGELDTPEKAVGMSSSHGKAADTDGVIQEWFMALEYVAHSIGQRTDESDGVPAEVANVGDKLRGVGRRQVARNVD